MKEHLLQISGDHLKFLHLFFYNYRKCICVHKTKMYLEASLVYNCLSAIIIRVEYFFVYSETVKQGSHLSRSVMITDLHCRSRPVPCLVTLLSQGYNLSSSSRDLRPWRNHSIISSETRRTWYRPSLTPAIYKTLWPTAIRGNTQHCLSYRLIGWEKATLNT